MSAPTLMRISRRTTLQWLAGTMALSGVAACTDASKQSGAPKESTAALSKGKADAPKGKGYGTDPDLLNPTVPWERTLSASQLQMAALLADLIVPGSADAPAPSALGIQDFVDEWVSAPYPEQQADRAVILEGFEWIEGQAQRRWRQGFVQLDEVSRRTLLDAMVPASAKDARAEHQFFRRFRYVVVGAYYTTAEGAKALGYVGNVALPSYPSITAHEKAVLDAQLRKLGIA